MLAFAIAGDISCQSVTQHSCTQLAVNGTQSICSPSVSLAGVTHLPTAKSTISATPCREAADDGADAGQRFFMLIRQQPSKVLPRHGKSVLCTNLKPRMARPRAPVGGVERPGDIRAAQARARVIDFDMARRIVATADNRAMSACSV